MRIRQKGYENQNFFVSTYSDADDAIERIETERRHGLFVTRCASSTKAPKSRLGRSRYFIADSKDELTNALAKRECCLREGKEPPVIRAGRIPRHRVEWLPRPLAAITGHRDFASLSRYVQFHRQSTPSPTLP